ncbi:hypothetical protein [uncultured Microbacterium sp.]|uniref:hypothetical protein n=1 Tax=uncultured Microbacterium sp. TaxID=191216 RepID=UPI0025E51363|nr:hypothetical protein [uncultured Microbacterium sp.]
MSEDYSLQEALERAVPDPDPRHTRRRGAAVWVVIMLIAGAVIAGVLALSITAAQQGQQIQTQHADATKQEAVIDDQADAIRALQDQVKQLGGTPVITVTGATGATGSPGRAPTTAEISAAVAAYCAQNNGCDGKNGADGSNGAAGADGQDAPAVTADQIAAAIQECFSSGACIAPKGDTGATGADGATGPSGPACTEGYTPTPLWVNAATAQDQPRTLHLVVACTPPATPTPTPTPTP